MPENHLLFTYHWLKKTEEEMWDRLGANLGTMWSRKALKALAEKPAGSSAENERIFVPLSLVVNPELPNALLGIQPKDTPGAPGGTPQPTGDGLLTEMAIPSGDEVVNMADLDKGEFFGLISNAGLATQN